MSTILGSLFLLIKKTNKKGIFATSVATIQVQPGEKIYLSKNMPVFKSYEFHIIFLMLWFLLAIDGFPMARI